MRPSRVFGIAIWRRPISGSSPNPDPRGFLAQAARGAAPGAIIDEIQNVPELLSYIQVDVDERERNGLYVLTGSRQFGLSRAISQSLAGRTALLRLLPFSMAERARTGASMEIDEVIFSGFYPRILTGRLDPPQALGDYFETYVERDVRNSSEIRNLSGFRRFVRLCAGRVGQLVNFSSLGADAGVSHTTAREWLTTLEASYVAFRLQPYHANIAKRLIKSPKLYFHDVGLAGCLIGIENARQVATHPLRGPLFENAVVAEVLKHRFNRGRQPHIWFFRDSGGLECDLLHQTGRGFDAIEIKSGATVSGDYFAALHKVARIVPGVASKTVVYGGAARMQRSDATVVPFADVARSARPLRPRPRSRRIHTTAKGTGTRGARCRLPRHGVPIPHPARDRRAEALLRSDRSPAVLFPQSIDEDRASQWIISNR